MHQTPEWLDRLERRFGEVSIPGLPAFLVGMNAVVGAMTLAKPDFPRVLALEPDLLLAGQAWRAATFLFIPPLTSPLWLFFWLLVFFTYASALESEWGEFRFCFFYGVGALATAAASAATGIPLSNAALNSSIFLAFAALYPDFELLLFFVLPVKVKWLAWFAWGGVALGLVFGGAASRTGLVAGLLNYGLFFGRGHWEQARGLWRDLRRGKER